MGTFASQSLEARPTTLRNYTTLRRNSIGKTLSTYIHKKKNNGYTRPYTQPYSEPYPIDPDLD
jgi:hypothetical protein